MWGPKTVIGDVTQAAYLGPWLWKLTVEKAGSFDIDKVAAASPGVEFKGAPEGYVRVHENHHLWSKTRVGRARTDGQYDLIYETADPDGARSFPEGLSMRLRPVPADAVHRRSPLLYRRGSTGRTNKCSANTSFGDFMSIMAMQGFAGLILFSVFCSWRWA
jgi:hypothetical protein